MLIVITVAAVMLAVSVTTIHLLLRAEHEATKTARYAVSVARLAHAFRDDLHFARDVALPPVEPGNPVALVATLETRETVRYELDAHRATRIATGAGETSRDEFYFPPETRLSFERIGDAGLWRLAIEMPRASSGTGPEPALPAKRTVNLAIEASPAPFLRRKSDSEGREAQSP